MTFKSLNKELDGERFRNVFSTYRPNNYELKQLMRDLSKYLETEKIYVEFTDGARKGTIARWDIDSAQALELYATTNLASYYRDYAKINIPLKFVFDDRDTVITLDSKNFPAVLLFGSRPTNWVFTRNAKQHFDPPEMFDHFGTLLEVGQLIMAPVGTKGYMSTRFAKIVNISERGTIKVQTIKSRKGHREEISNLSPTISSHDIIVIDSMNMEDKLMIAKLSL